MGRSSPLRGVWHAAHHHTALRSALAILLTASLLAVQPRMVDAQTISAVFDAQNFVQNVRSAVATAQQVQLTIRDLAPFTRMGAALNVANQLPVLLAQVRTTADKISGRRSLWSQPYPITSIRELAAFRSSSQQLCRTVVTDALGIQGLITEAMDLLSTLNTLVDSLDVIAGGVAGLQSVSASLGSLGGQMVVLQTLQAGNNEAILCEQWTKAIRREAIDTLQQRLFLGYGEVQPR